jgi:hypothetical protein
MVKKSALRYTIFGVLLAAAGLLSAFLIDRGDIAKGFSQVASVVSSITGGDGTNKNANETSGENNDPSLITPIIKKIGSLFADGSLTSSLSKIGEPWGSVTGLTMFRGSPTRTFYGLGPLPANPKVLWRYPDKPMCSFSEAEGVTKQWCGSGWTGQPVVWERPDGVTEVIFGAYDGAVHFVNARTGKDTRPKFQTGDLIKGSVTLDPDGYPLLYFGSRDNKLRILSLDANGLDGVPVELWALNANVVKGKWNNDWDGNPVVINDMLFEGGENSWFFVMKINRSYREIIDANGQATDEKKVAVAPEIIFKMPGWNAELLKNIGDQTVSIETSVVFFGDRVYFTNSGGRVVGLDISDIENGVAPIVFDYWVGDDVDATIVVDEKGMLYVSAELERNTARSLALGQFIKLDPYKQTVTEKTVATDGTITTQVTGDPFVWGIKVPKGKSDKGGIWSTPALSGNYLYAATHTGRLLTVDKETGSITYETYIGEHAWSSPIVIENADANGTKKLLVGTCVTGGFKQYDLTNPALPKLTNTMPLASGSCIESTPAVWKGQIFVGSRDGYFYSFAD